MVESEDDDSEEEEVKVEVKSKPDHRDKENVSVSTRKRKKKKEAVTFCVTDCKYEVIFNAVKSMGWRLVGSTPSQDDGGGGNKHCGNDELTSCNVHWVDVANVNERMAKMAPWQHINHFPGMTNIARKAKLASNLEKMRREFPKEYAFYPRTWVLPLEMGDFRTQFDSKGMSSRVFIIKPDAGCQGRGIFLTQDLNKVPSSEQMVAQQYIRRPLLIDGFKFDLRVYILVTSCAPLRMYMFHDGLVRLCTSEYVKPTQENLSERCMHLTNYAINKMSDNFVQNEGTDTGEGSKRSLKWFMEYISNARGEEKAQLLWRKIGAVAVKVVSSILPTLQREYGEKFERTKNLKEFRRRAEATAAAIAEAKANSVGGGGGGGDSGNGISKGFAFGSGREDASHRVRRAEAAAAALERLKEEEANMRRAKQEEKKLNGDDGEEEDDSAEALEGSHCFELLGVDIMIDQQLKPWLIEINHLPSFATDSVLDQDIKSAVIEQTLRVVNAAPGDRRKYDDSNKRNAGVRLYGRQVSGLNTFNNISSSSSSVADSSISSSNKNISSSSSLGGGKRPNISPIETKRPESISVAMAKKRIIAVYSVYAPERLNMVDALLTKYSGREAKLVAAVESKYVGNKQTGGGGGGGGQSNNNSTVVSQDSNNNEQLKQQQQSEGGGECDDQQTVTGSENGEKPGAAGLVPEEGAWNHVLSFDSAVSVPRAGVIPSMRRRPDNLTSPLPSPHRHNNQQDPPSQLLYPNDGNNLEEDDEEEDQAGAAAGGGDSREVESRVRSTSNNSRGNSRQNNGKFDKNDKSKSPPAQSNAEVPQAPGKPQGDLCDLLEARRRIDAMYSLRWRHGLSAQQHAKILASEDELLVDFDRIFPVPKDLVPPPPTPSSSSSSSSSSTTTNRNENDKDGNDSEGEDENNDQSQRTSVYIPDFDRMFTHAFEYEDKKLRRMYGTKPSQSIISDNETNNDTSSTSSILPPIGNGGFCFGSGNDDDKGGRNVFGDPFKQGKIERAGDAKLLPKPGPKQAAAAERLTRGYSALRQTQSAPPGPVEEGNNNNGGGSSGSVGGGGGVGDGEEEEVGTTRFSEQVAYAKKLRERAVANKQKRSNAVVLKPTMYCFSDNGPLVAGSSNHFGQAGF